MQQQLTNKSIFLQFIIVLLVFSMSNIVLAKDIEITCNDPDQCRDKFVAISEWIKSNSLLPIVVSSNNFENGLLVTEKSNSAGYVILNGRQETRNLATDFVVEIINDSSISIKTGCESFFGCTPSITKDVINKYIDDREQFILQKRPALNAAILEDSVRFNQQRVAEESSRLAKESSRLAKLEIIRKKEIERQKLAPEIQRMTSEFRSKVKLGDESHCGMIVDLRAPLVKVQTIVGERWFRVEQIYPVGGAPCTFLNNTYQDIGNQYGFD
jgi:hypothetical protein